MGKSCENCGYYKKYYILSSDGRFIYANNGFCKKTKMHYLKRDRKGNFSFCEYWIQAEEKTELYKEKLKSKIAQAVQKTLEAIELKQSDIFD